MKIINSVQAQVAWNFSYDEAATARGVLGQDLAAYLVHKYRFSAKPDQQVAGQVPMMSFTGGSIELPDGKAAIVMLNIAIQAGNITAAAKNSVLAEEMLVAIASDLDERFGYQIIKSVRDKYAQSGVAFEFSEPVEKKLKAFQRISALLEKELPRPSNLPFAFKQLIFGSMDYSLLTGGAGAADLLKLDFSIERRAHEPIEANRYFSTAPVSTAEHERLLQLIEDALSD